MDRITLELAQELTLDMIPEGILKEMAEAIGPVNLVKVLDLVNGDTVYLPKAESVLRPVRDQHIKKEFNGHNHSELARKYNLSERYMRDLCGEGMIEGQLMLPI